MSDDGYGWQAILGYYDLSGVSYYATSILRPGDSGRHGIGCAVDAGGDYEAMAEAILAARPAVFEAIWRGGERGNLSIKRGEFVDPSFWGADVWQAHGGDNEHMHLACYIDATEGPGFPTAPIPVPPDPWPIELFVPILIGG